MFLKKQMSILELFLNDHVTLKTGVMPAQNSVLPSDILKYIKIENRKFKL